MVTKYFLCVFLVVFTGSTKQINRKRCGWISGEVIWKVRCEFPVTFQVTLRSHHKNTSLILLPSSLTFITSHKVTWRYLCRYQLRYNRGDVEKLPVDYVDVYRSTDSIIYRLQCSHNRRQNMIDNVIQHRFRLVLQNKRLTYSSVKLSRFVVFTQIIYAIIIVSEYICNI